MTVTEDVLLQGIRSLHSGNRGCFPQFIKVTRLFFFSSEADIRTDLPLLGEEVTDPVTDIIEEGPLESMIRSFVMNLWS